MLLLYHPAGFSEKDNFQPLPVNFYPLELMFSPGRETSCEASNHSLPVKAKQPALLGGLIRHKNTAFSNPNYTEEKTECEVKYPSDVK